MIRVPPVAEGNQSLYPIAVPAPRYRGRSASETTRIAGIAAGAAAAVDAVGNGAKAVAAHLGKA